MPLGPKNLSGRNKATSTYQLPSLRHNQHSPILKSDDVLRFIRYLKDKVDLSGCWIWEGMTDKDGYGKFFYKKRTERAHRVSWILFKGEIPEELYVCHTCDNRSCVNPYHLFLGTNQENTKDRDNKERQARGEKQGASLLTSEEVKYIRDNYRRGNGGILARKFGVSRSAISCITTGKYWRHLNG